MNARKRESASMTRFRFQFSILNFQFRRVYDATSAGFR